MGLLVTRVKAGRFHSLSSSCFRSWGIINNYYFARNDRIWFCWDKACVALKFISWSDQVMHCDIQTLDGQLDAVVSSVYAYNSRMQRCKLWEDLMTFQGQCNKPWMVLGDFNAFIKKEEKIGYDGITVEPCDEMRHCLIHCGLEDLNGTGCFHTWYNNQNSSSWMRIKLNRVLGDSEWLNNIKLGVGMKIFSILLMQAGVSK